MIRRLLVIDARVPTPDRDGGSFRMMGLMRAFQRLDFAVHFVPSFPSSFPPFDSTLSEDTLALENLGVSIARERTVDEHLAANGSRYDIVLLTGTFVASRHVEAVGRLAPRAVVLFDTIDLHFMREYRAARLSGNVPRLQAALRIKSVELALARAADATLVVSDNERRLLAEQTPPIASWVVPMSMEQEGLPAEACSPDGRDGLLFLGAFSFDPNPDAVLFFVREILPLLQRRQPGLRFRVVGSDPAPDLQALGSSTVRVEGFAPRLADVFAAARIFVAPLRYGAGIKTKVLQSMAFGVPVIASSIAAEGIGARADKELLLADRPEDWVGHVARLSADDVLWRRLSANGRALIARRYSMAALQSSLAALVGELMARRRGAEHVCP